MMPGSMQRQVIVKRKSYQPKEIKIRVNYSQKQIDINLANIERDIERADRANRDNISNRMKMSKEMKSLSLDDFILKNRKFYSEYVEMLNEKYRLYFEEELRRVEMGEKAVPLKSLSSKNKVLTDEDKNLVLELEILNVVKNLNVDNISVMVSGNNLTQELAVFNDDITKRLVLELLVICRKKVRIFCKRYGLDDNIAEIDSELGKYAMCVFRDLDVKVAKMKENEDSFSLFDKDWIKEKKREAKQRLFSFRSRALFYANGKRDLIYYKKLKELLSTDLSQRIQMYSINHPSDRYVGKGEEADKHFEREYEISTCSLKGEFEICRKKVEELTPSWMDYGKSFIPSRLSLALGFYKAVRDLDEEDLGVGLVAGTMGGVGALGVAMSVEAATTSVGGIAAVGGGVGVSALMGIGVIGTTIIGIKTNRALKRRGIRTICEIGKVLQMQGMSGENKGNDSKFKNALRYITKFKILPRFSILFVGLILALNTMTLGLDKLGSSLFDNLWEPVRKYIDKINFWGSLSLFGATIGINIPFIERWCINTYKYGKLAMKVYVAKKVFDYTYKASVMAGMVTSFVVVGLKSVF